MFFSVLSFACTIATILHAFPVYYQEFEAKIAIDTLEVIAGSLPRRALALVQEWAEAHQPELQANWIFAEQRKPLSQIEPLE